MVLSKDLFYVGVNDYMTDLFEGQYPVPNGMAYNSYIIKDEKIAVIDSVDERFSDKWLNNIKDVLNNNTPDYLVVLHMEPDHSGSILAFMKEYPNTKIVSSQKAFQMMKNFYDNDFKDNQIIVNDSSSLSLGSHELTFISAPMVHWPEVLVAYENVEKTLFSADAFGKFGALDVNEDWACEARRYYVGIVGKYGVQVQNLLKKLSGFEVNRICPLHGPVLSDNLGYYLDLYNTWSLYNTETDGVFIAYTSVYGNTKKAVLELEKSLLSKGVNKVVITDLARCDMSEAVEDAFRYGKIVLATTTYNGNIFPFMHDFINHLIDHNFQNKTIGFIENGTWAPVATKVMKTLLEGCKNLTFTNSNVKILSALKQENLIEIDNLANELK